jgi:glycosyltransferase involved in cell wall biosynthesis
VFFQNEVDRSLFVSNSLVKTNQAELVPGSGVNLNYYSWAKLEEKSQFCFLMVARILKDKGVIEYLECARRLRDMNAGITFQLVGAIELSNHFGGIDREKIYGYHEKGIIEYTEQVDDIRPFIERSDCVVLPSYREGLSRILLEAAAMGRPIIASDVPGCREVVEPHRNGILCQAGSVESLETAMWEIFKTSHEDRVVMGTESRMIAVERFDEQFVISKYLIAIRACANK